MRGCADDRKGEETTGTATHTLYCRYCKHNWVMVWCISSRSALLKNCWLVEINTYDGGFLATALMVIMALLLVDDRMSSSLRITREEIGMFSSFYRGIGVERSLIFYNRGSCQGNNSYC